MSVLVHQKGKTWYVLANHRGFRKEKAIGDRKEAEQLASVLRLFFGLFESGLTKEQLDNGLKRARLDRQGRAGSWA